MKVILIEDVQGLGKKGDLVNAKPGYFNNFLAKNELAVLATPAVMKKWKEQQKELKKQQQEAVANAEAMKKKIEDTQLRIKTKGGAGGRLFGSITSKDIAEELVKSTGIEIDKKKIEMKENIRSFGGYTVDVRVFPEMVAKLKVLVEEA